MKSQEGVCEELQKVVDSLKEKVEAMEAVVYDPQKSVEYMEKVAQEKLQPKRYKPEDFKPGWPVTVTNTMRIVGDITETFLFKCLIQDYPDKIRGMCGHVYRGNIFEVWWAFIWTFAPSNATHGAYDSHGTWNFFKGKPDKTMEHGYWHGNHVLQFVFIPHPDWENSLQERP